MPHKEIQIEQLYSKIIYLLTCSHWNDLRDVFNLMSI
ncbi:uncharacterized protein METZ01_LOCUS203529 [marine metagenome]|uniref:Uncharacterized protein n=1 Tax=marine metagenome TaxID=408172 RepID=A0A382EJN2_9ZZZZ